MLLLLSAAHAATLTVGTSGSAQYASIALAVAAARPGDVVEVEPGEYLGGVDFGGRAIELRSRDGAATTVIRGGASVLLAMDQGESGVVVEGFTLSNPGGVPVWVEGGATVTLRDVVVEDSGYDGAYGGGLAIGTGYVTVEDAVFRRNTGTWGGHVFLGAGTLTVLNSTFEEGDGYYGGAFYLNGGTSSFVGSTVSANTGGNQAGGLYVGYGAALTLEDTAVVGNFSAANHGGGIYLGGANTLTTVGGRISGNQITTWESGYYGGGIAAPNGATIHISGTELAENTAYYGGAIYGYYLTLTLDGADISRNYAYYGGALFEAYSSVTSSGTLWDSNTTYYSGGNIYAAAGTAYTFTGDTFYENLATYGSGAAFYGSTTTVTAVDTRFEKNLAYYYGGGLFLSSQAGPTTLTRCLFDQNEGSYSAGGALYAEYYSSIVAEDTTFSRNTSASDGAGYLYYGSNLTGTRLSVSGNQGGAGSGAFRVYGSVPTSVQLVDSSFADNLSDGDAGALNLLSITNVSVTGSTFERNRAGSEAFGGALLLDGTGSAVVQGNTFAFNVARYGGAAYVDASVRTSLWSNNTFVENTAANGGAACVVASADETWTNNTFIGNSATEAGGALCLVDSVIDVRNNLLAWTSEGAAVHVWTSGKVAPTFGYNAFHENLAGDAGGDAGDVAGAPGSVSGDPMLVAYTRNGEIEDDLLLPLRDSPLVDAGDPTRLDPDGSVSDIGATGGPGASADDADLDGYPASTDCDDTNAQVNPDAFETWYDGVNSDCRGVSDFDQDGDGADAQTHGGSDCDDTDPMSATPCTDTGTTGEDPDPEKPGPDTTVGGGCGCAAGGGGSAATAAWVTALAVLLGRRRATGRRTRG